MAFWNSGQITSINDGVIPNDGTGDAIRDAFIKVNNNFGNISTQLAQPNQNWSSANVQIQLDTNYLNASNLFVANSTGTNSTVSGNITTGNLNALSGIYNSGTSYFGNTVSVGGNIVPTVTGVNLGSATHPFANLYVQNTVSTTQINQSSDAGILKIHANAFIGDVQDTGILGNITSDYNGANTYAFFGHQYTTNNFIYKITNTDPTISGGNSIVAGGFYGNAQFGSGLFSNATQSTSATTGALIVTGGVGIGANLTIGGNANIAGNATVGNLSIIGSGNINGSPIITTNTPGVGIFYSGGSIFTTAVAVNLTTPSTSYNSGAMVVQGGVGIAGNLNVNSTLSVAGNVNATGLTGQVYGVQNNITSMSIGSGAVTISNSGQINGSSLNATSLGVTNITATGTLNFTGATVIGLLSLGITGNLTASNVVANQFVGSLQGSVLQAAQTNITTVGTLNGLSVTGTGVFDNGNRVLTTSTGAGNLAISGTTVTLPATGPGTTTFGSSTAIPVITHDVYGRASSVTTAAVIAPAGTLSGSTLASGVTASSLTSVGTIITGTWSGLFGTVSGANLTNLTAGNLTGTIPSAVLGNSTYYIGTTAITLNRASASQSLTGINIDGTANNITAYTINQNVGSANSPTFAGVTVPNITHSGTSGSGDIGASGAAFGTVYATATSAKYADIAEIYSTDADYEPGTVVVFGGSNEITVTTRFADARVAGAISTNPAYLMNNEAKGLPVALRGRIPVKVTGPVAKGDSLVTSGNAGFAISVGTDTTYGQAVFAKAIETNTEDGEKVITAVII
jgi:hypothetical protein